MIGVTYAHAIMTMPTDEQTIMIIPFVVSHRSIITRANIIDTTAVQRCCLCLFEWQLYDLWMDYDYGHVKHATKTVYLLYSRRVLLVEHRLKIIRFYIKTAWNLK